MRRTRLEKVQVCESHACGITQAAEAAAFDSELAMPRIAQRFDAGTVAVEIIQTTNQRHEVDDRFGSEPGDRSRPDVFDLYQNATQCFG
jgi:hypothetical protein